MRRPSARRVLPALGVLLLLGACAPAQSGGAAARAPAASTSAQRDWRDATYRLTCDGIAPGGFAVTLRDGSARVPADGIKALYEYDHYDVQLVGQATGDLAGDGKPDTVVLLQCSPQPSNAFLQEAQVFRADGSLLGELPSTDTLPETTILAPLYLPTGLSIQHGDVVAQMLAYGPGDSHATGPHVPFTVTWHWNGAAFVRVGES
jgi:hypothetical protein